MRERGATIAEGVKNAPEKNKLRLNIRIMALGLFGLQALVLMVLSYRQYLHFGLTIDYSYFEQTLWLLAHGSLYPRPPLLGGMPFWRMHFELLMWPLAIFYWLWPNGPILLFVQDLAAVGAEWFGFLLVRKFMRTHSSSETWIQIVTVSSIILLVVNPWTFWAESFDFHFHAIEACLITSGLWAFFDDRRRLGYGLMALTLLASQVSTTYLVPAGVTIFLIGRNYRKDGILVSLLGLVWFVFTEHLGVNGLGVTATQTVSSGSVPHSVSALSYLPKSVVGLIGLVTHPKSIIQAIWSVRWNILSNAGAVGYIGLLSSWGLIPVLVIIETSLAGGALFSGPGDNTIAMWALILVGSMVWINRLYLWRKWLGITGLVLVFVSSIGWAITGYSALPTKYTMASSGGAKVLDTALRRIPPQDEVIVSQGVLGRFTNRYHAYPLYFGSVPIYGPRVYFVFSPFQGINVLYNQAIASRMQYLVTTLHATVMDHQDGIWIFRWTAPRGTTNLVWPSTDSRIMAWTVQSAVGHRIMQGSPSHWSVVANNSNAGYVLNGDYWRLPKGRYQASVSLQSSGPVNVEVWNDTGGVLLARRSLPRISGPQTLHVNFTVAHQYPRRIYSGIGPFRYQPVIPTLDNNIEVRVWTPGHDHVAVNWVGMQARK
jgi:hypothetical protein